MIVSLFDMLYFFQNVWSQKRQHPSKLKAIPYKNDDADLNEMHLILPVVRCHDMHTVHLDHTAYKNGKINLYIYKIDKL